MNAYFYCVDSSFIHHVWLQRAKTNAAIEKAIAAEKSAAAAGSKIKVLEDEIDEIRAKHRNTPEVALLQQMAEVKGPLADSQRRIETIKAEKAEIVLEKEQFRASVNKLVSLITSSIHSWSRFHSLHSPTDPLLGTG